MSADILATVIAEIKESPMFALQLDESTDEEYLFCKSLPTTTRGEDVFQTLKEFIEENGLDWLKLVGICTDGAPSMMGIRSGFQSLVKQVAPQVFNYHCLRQRYALAVKTLPPDLLNTLSDIVKIVNHIRGSATNSRLFKVLCDEMFSVWVQRTNNPLLDEVTPLVCGENRHICDAHFTNICKVEYLSTNSKTSLKVNALPTLNMPRFTGDPYLEKNCLMDRARFRKDNDDIAKKRAYVKIESERLRFIKFNQTKLRTEEYIHLRDAVLGNVDAINNISHIGTAYILPSSYPRHMQEYIQDAMAYVRAYDRPNLFITFTCNPKWDKIKKLLMPGQTTMDRHDITARVFKQKLKSLINFIVDWQEREIDDIISAEIPDKNVDEELFDIITTNMIHGPCGTLSIMSPCMDNGKCTKHFPKSFQNDTITDIDGYPAYRRRDVDNGRQCFELRLTNGGLIDVDNRWVVPYSPLLCKTYKAHINVELCSSVKSIKYICKYVHTGSNKAIFAIKSINENDEITGYQMGRYVSSNEAIWIEEAMKK
ncbi:uncharacterized protein LOC113390957 [Ctenocephalides felis]|uniref:uncharacterized protein LOC113390957 n=1 Tax=Ctenocephalides felis TaxID=7515 RepID=UPI000E6E381B|nr:uncharacterized protein LOC113390957 [Ctenocephalides felis]